MQGAEKGTGSSRRIVGVLDIGSFKIACLIAVISPGAANPIRIAGVGHVPSRGVKSGVIVDLGEAEHSIRAAIAQAERMAGVRLSEVAISISCGRLMSQTFAASAQITHGIVYPEDLAKLQSGGRAYAERGGRRLIHLNPVGYRLDGAPGMREPLGMAAQKLSADLHAVTVDEAPLRNLLFVIERCYLTPNPLLPAPYASALAATSEDERRVGVICLDIGGGTTSIAAFQDGQYIFSESIPVGGMHITLDIARALQTPLEEAERIKALYGTVGGAQSDEHEVFSYPLAGDEDAPPLQSTKAQLAGLVRPRLESLLRLAADRIGQSAVLTGAPARVVLTGGTSQLPGVADLTASVVKRPVRAGRPRQVSGLPPLMSGPAFAGVVGVLLSSFEDQSQLMPAQHGVRRPHGYLGRVGQWLKDGF